MSTFPDLIHEDEKTKTTECNLTHSYNYNNNRYSEHVLKPKNIFKSNSKCSKALKRKLKKYKLRKDGKEDPDIIDVSQTLLSSLKIVSPRKPTNNNFLEDEFACRPRNYLFKMAKRKLKPKPECGSIVQTVEPKDTKKQEPSPIINTEEKKHTNAFKLLMEARNKSIGSNSPGKDADKSTESPEIIEKKNIKVKRNLALQKMAEAKATKKQEIEKHHEECIKRKMEARAERLKSMITKTGKLKQKKTKNKIKLTLKESNVKKSINENVKCNELIENVTETNAKSDSVSSIIDAKEQPKTLKLVSIFDSETDVDMKPKKKVSKEDKEFLSKLSPSIKKKENMLCYFKKVDKDLEVSNDIAETVDENTSSIIKVKMTPRNKKKIKSKKLRLKKRESNEVLKDYNEISNEIESKTTIEVTELVDSISNNSDRRKRKRKDDLLNIEKKKQHSEELVDINNDGRPKRSVKKPIKYVDDVLFSSSEDEAIFTPKKRRHSDKKVVADPKSKNIVNISEDKTNDGNIQNTAKKNNLNSKKPAKLAPIFSTKPQITQEQLEAKQKFLHSGIPEQLKKIISKQKKDDVDYANIFHTVIHVQQNKSIEPTTSSSNSFYDNNDDSEQESLFKDDSIFSKLLNNPENSIRTVPVHQNTETVLQDIKNTYPQFPVYRTYRLLKGKSRGEFSEAVCPNFDNSIEIINCMNDTIYESPDKLTLTDKYKPTLSSQIIGNFGSIKELKKWLISWTENDSKIKNTNSGSESSDFCYSDTDSRENIKSMNNLLVLTGPAGSGKTSSVYAVAAELAIKVIEVNASSKRTGKMMLQDLQEATQSHKVNRGNSCSENSLKSQEPKNKFALKTYKKKGRPKKVVVEESTKKEIDKNENLSQQSTSQEKARTGMSLILIDDADIVFEQDDGFASAVSQLINSSKRPVILVTSSLMCPHLQRFIQYGRIIKLRPLLPRMLGTWLDIMCLAENGLAWHGLGAKFLNLFNGDIRKTINYLQFYLGSHTKRDLEDESSQQNSQYYKPILEDETSNMSWADRADNDNLEQQSQMSADTEISVAACDDAWKYFMNNQLNIRFCRMPFALFNSWWSVPTIFDALYTKQSCLLTTKQKSRNVKELECLANVLDNFSTADTMSRIQRYNRMNIAFQPWKSFESDSVSELEDPNSYNRNYEINNDIVHDLVLRSVINSQRTLGIEEKTDLDFPGMDFERNRQEILSLHDGITNCLNPSVSLDRRSLALDYWSGCRTISRIERTKVDIVSKRNNRFCHYLKSLNIFCKNDSYDKLTNSLMCKNDLNELDCL